MKRPLRHRVENLEDRCTPGETFESILPLLTAGPLALPLMLSEPSSDHLVRLDHGSGWDHQTSDGLSLETLDPRADDRLVNLQDEADARSARDSGHSATVSITDGGTATSRLAEDLDWLPVRFGGPVNFVSGDGPAAMGSTGPAAPVVSIEGGSVGDGFTRPTPPVAMPPNVSQSMGHPDVVAGIQASGVVVGAHAGVVDLGGGVTTSPIAYTTVDNMAASDDLWWFGGVTPPYYSTLVRLAATPSDGSYYASWRWTIASGTAMVDFEGRPSQDVVEFQVGGTTSEIGLVSMAASSVLNDVRIEVQGYNGYLQQWSAVIGSVSLAVPTPHHLVNTKIEDKASAMWGYESWLYYRIEDQFSKVLPREVGVNEKWTGDPVADYAGTDWRRGKEINGTVNPAIWADQIGGELADKTPTPQAPPPVGPPGITKVQHWSGEWYVGSTTSGEGIRVQTNTWQKYRDHARHENVTSPP